MKKPIRARTLRSGRTVKENDESMKLTIDTKCPDKWLFVDLESGNVWHKREGETELNGHFWRRATEEEMTELEELVSDHFADQL